MHKENLFGSTLSRLEEIVSELGLPIYSARQIALWLYRHRAESFEEMTNISKKIRAELDKHYYIGINSPVSFSESDDGTKKYLYKISAAAGNSVAKYIETAWIPEKNRGTLCVSSQIGCKRGCSFCMTGKQGLQGNLSAGEILNQYRSLPEAEKVTNFVFMGMGEPLDNIEEVLNTLEILTSEWGYGFSPKKVTVSTIGILDGLKKLLDSSSCRLALSLHSPFPEEREKIIPSEKTNPFKEVLRIFRENNSVRSSRRRLTVEYVMLSGVNDTPGHSSELARVLNGLNVRVNLIPYHSIPGFSGKPSPPEKMEAFRTALLNKGIFATIRKSRGQDIQAACGMLSTGGNI